MGDPRPVCTASPGRNAVFTPKSSLTRECHTQVSARPTAGALGKQAGRPGPQDAEAPAATCLWSGLPGLHLRGCLCLPCAPAAPGRTSSPGHTSPPLRGVGGHHQAFPSEQAGVTNRLLLRAGGGPPLYSPPEQAGVTPSLPLRAAGSPLSFP